VDRPRHPRARARSAVATRLRRRLRPPRTLRPTRAGWCFFALTFGVGFAALNTGNNLLYLVLAFMLSFLVLSGVLSESALRGIRVRRRVAREVFAESPAPVALEIENRLSRVPAFALVIEDLDERELPTGRVFALRVGPGGRETRSYGLIAPRRGLFRFGGFRVSTRFPFGLFSKATVLVGEEAILVYPSLDSVPPARPDDDAREGETSRTQRGFGTEAVGLREYAPGDAHRRIHWKASVRRGELLVRETEREREARIEVRLATRAAPGAAFERAVRRAASEVVAALDAGLRVALATEKSAFEPGTGPRHRARLLAFLARVESTKPP
jgi:uncharacterized protein (DUF58 family)